MFILARFLKQQHSQDGHEAAVQRARQTDERPDDDKQACRVRELLRGEERLDVVTVHHSQLPHERGAHVRVHGLRLHVLALLLRVWLSYCVLLARLEHLDRQAARLPVELRDSMDNLNSLLVPPAAHEVFRGFVEMENEEPKDK